MIILYPPIKAHTKVVIRLCCSILKSKLLVLFYLIIQSKLDEAPFEDLLSLKLNPIMIRSFTTKSLSI